MANGDEFEPNGTMRETMSVRLPGGTQVTFTSRWIVVIALLVAATAAGSISMYMLYRHIEDVREHDRQLVTKMVEGDKEILLATKAEISGLRIEQIKTTEAQNELNYIMTLTSEQREKLKLRMPESLRKKLGGGIEQ